VTLTSWVGVSTLGGWYVSLPHGPRLVWHPPSSTVAEAAIEIVRIFGPGGLKRLKLNIVEICRFGLVDLFGRLAKCSSQADRDGVSGHCELRYGPKPSVMQTNYNSIAALLPEPSNASLEESYCWRQQIQTIMCFATAIERG